MDGILLELALGGAAGLLAGATVAWWLRSRQAEREYETAEQNWQRKVEQATAQARVLTDRTTSLQVNLAETQKLALASKHEAVSKGTEVESVKERLLAVAKELTEARAERDELGQAAETNRQSFDAARQRLEAIAQEFEKSRQFYKGQIGKAIEQRQVLEQKVENLSSEKQSLTNLLASSKAEHDSINRMLRSARERLEGLDRSEQRVIELEADNAELRHQLDSGEREIGNLHRQLETLDDLRGQNQELTHRLESVEASRRQLEADTHRYREQLEHSEAAADDLRNDLATVQSELKAAEARQSEPQEIAKIPQIGVSKPPDDEGDDLKEIVGIGKVFEAMLHRLGIYYFRQIATFGPTELARINAELKEFKGRVEHDDWIGQARELHFKKYGMGGSLQDVN